MTFCVYAIQNQFGRIYIGQTMNFFNRLLIHNKGGVRPTAADRLGMP
jgi:predicted GIY-YIG superfamily endonuclease